ncbi:MAG: MBL fold metallo-hydrolase [SAR324 cluster bacterium]|nr:MBL fold metallo-hydrolase [SAR324 cluster bacterium]
MRGLLFLACLLWPSLVFAQTKFVMVDVGEGQTVFFQVGPKAILIDPGPVNKASLVLERLKAHGVVDLQVVVVTHPHPDHASAYFRIKEAFPKAKIYHNCIQLQEGQRVPVMRWLVDDLAKNKNAACLGQGQKFVWQGFHFSALWPPKAPQRHINDHSIVLFAQFNGVTALLMADASSAVERQLLKNWKAGPVDLYIAGHHGAKDTGLKAWLRLIQPQWSLISVDKHNYYGYPSQAVMKKLNKASTNVRSTSKAGEVCLNLDKKPLKLCKD